MKHGTGDTCEKQKVRFNILFYILYYIIIDNIYIDACFNGKDKLQFKFDDTFECKVYIRD